MPYKLDIETLLIKTEDEYSTALVSKDYWNFNSAFGGWSAAIATEAVISELDFRGEIVHLDATMVRPIKEGIISIFTKKIHRGKTTDFWQVKICKANEENSILYECQITTSLVQTSDINFQPPFPKVIDPERVKPQDVTRGPRWMQLYDQRPVLGAAFKKNTTPYSAVWTKDKEDRPLDAKAIVSLCDTLAPRPYFMSDNMFPIATFSYSVSLFSTARELNKNESGFVLIEGDSHCIRNGTYHQNGRVWSRSGVLLAVTNQTAFFWE